jgi:hypothetical protein
MGDPSSILQGAQEVSKSASKERKARRERVRAERTALIKARREVRSDVQVLGDQLRRQGIDPTQLLEGDSK